MTGRIEYAIAAVGTEMLKKMLENIHSILSHIERVYDGHIERHNILIKLLGYVYYNTD